MSAPAAAPAVVGTGKAYDVALMKRLWGFVRPHKHLIALTLLFIPCTIALELSQPYMLKIAIQDHIAKGHPEGLGVIMLIYVALVLGQAMSSFGEQWALQLLGQRSMHGLRIAIYDHVMRQRAAFFDRMPVGRLMTRMTNDVESINEMFASGVVTLFSDFIKLVAILCIMFSMSVTLSLMTCLTFPLLLLLVGWARRAMRTSFREIRVRLAAMNAFAQEHLSGIRVVQLLGREQIATAEYNEVNAGHRDAYLLSIKADAGMYALVEAIGVVAIALIAWWAASRGVSGQTLATVGLVAVFIEYINKFFIPIRDLSAKYAVMQGAMAAIERIAELLDTDEPDGGTDGVEGTGTATATAAANMVSIKDLEFSYGAEPILRGVDLEIPRGATVAVVGPTGCGKSTVIKLLTRLYEAQRGEIRIADRRITDLPLAELRRRITVVSQDVFLFAGTVRENVAMGLGVVTDDQIRAAADRVGLTQCLQRRGADLDTKIAERGANFSAGERQLIAFARAMLRDPEFLILDEATAHVDPETEAIIERGVAALMRGRTTLVIAHRLSTIRNADMIAVVDRGRIVERGSHDQLVAAGGIYAALERTFHRGRAPATAS